MADDTPPSGGAAPWISAGSGRHSRPLSTSPRELAPTPRRNARLRPTRRRNPAAQTDPVVLGSGALLDVPIDALAASYEQVELIDIMHPREARRAAARQDNVVLRTEDISGAIALLVGLQRDTSAPLHPAPPRRRNSLRRRISSCRQTCSHNYPTCRTTGSARIPPYPWPHDAPSWRRSSGTIWTGCRASTAAWRRSLVLGYRVARRGSGESRGPNDRPRPR